MRYYVKNQADGRVLGYGESISSAGLLAKKMSNITGSKVGVFREENLLEGEEFENGRKINPPAQPPPEIKRVQSVVRTLQLNPDDHDWSGEAEGKTFCVRCGKSYSNASVFAKCKKQKIVIRRKSE